jgi:hypothetical protein
MIRSAQIRAADNERISYFARILRLLSDKCREQGLSLPISEGDGCQLTNFGRSAGVEDTAWAGWHAGSAASWNFCSFRIPQ